ADEAKLPAHAEGPDHAARDVRGFAQIVLGAGRCGAEDDLFRDAAAEVGGDLVAKLGLGHEKAVLGGPLERIAERRDAAGDDGDLLHDVARRHAHGDDRVAELVIGDALALVGVQYAALLLQTGDDALDGFLELGERDLVLVA